MVKFPEIPEEVRTDPVLKWAQQFVEDDRLKDEALYGPFLELKERYFTLLRRFLKIAKISDGFQLALKEVNALLDEAARKDYLTGLSNRRDIIEKIESEISRSKRRGTPFSIIIVDIDRFKTVNDTHGHAAGDVVLKSVADCLRRSLRLEDYCGRWGGEEFLICLSETGFESAMAVAEKLRANIEKLEVSYGDERLGVTASLGVSTRSGEDKVDRIISAADSAMYGAKRKGRNRVERLR